MPARGCRRAAAGTGARRAAQFLCRCADRAACGFRIGGIGRQG
ncbi:hypothetical protein RC1_2744 [Rhodospirillum centenum SW]|uniref:Uncharacterized protein n=1 Tax=Rhodospirillum centenum (strain ATCC 51521 / SW) TaxID=414684 RepID=B6IUD7_RHOCS|nr:hypothetical protein RC1_2744 [Rhodospirillum centenum SW]